MGLVLVQERDRTDKREVLHVIAAHARQHVGENHLRGKRIHDEQRLQQTLRVLVQPQDVAAVLRAALPGAASR